MALSHLHFAQPDGEFGITSIHNAVMGGPARTMSLKTHKHLPRPNEFQFDRRPKKRYTISGQHARIRSDHEGASISGGDTLSSELSYFAEDTADDVGPQSEERSGLYDEADERDQNEIAQTNGEVDGQQWASASDHADSLPRSAIPSRSSGNPVLPPTPPTAVEEVETQDKAMTPVTPPPQQSPPTPDLTPPRRFLDPQTSFVSTRADSFRTAREDFLSDNDSESPALEWEQNMQRSHSKLMSDSRMRHSNLSADVVSVTTQVPNAAQSASARTTDVREGPVTTTTNGTITSTDTSGPRPTSVINHELYLAITVPETSQQSTGNEFLDQSVHAEDVDAVTETAVNDTDPLHTPYSRRGTSLRDRLPTQRAHTSSTEKFGKLIGWHSRENIQDSKPASDASAASKVEAIVYETPPRRQQTLRHRGKKDSLRSVSSPVSAKSNRDSLYSNPESPPTLHRKRARLSNQDRSSYGSDVSRSFSVRSKGVPPTPETEVIKVAVIPERTSSLRSSNGSSRRNSVAVTQASGDYPPSAYHSREPGSELSYRRRSTSDSFSPNKPRARRYSEATQFDAPLVPPRKSSLSAPTSVSNSRTASLSSRSDRHRYQRIAAEEDLRKTLERMESERLMPKLQALAVTGQASALHEQNSIGSPVEPGTAAWASLRPQSVLETPFSQKSMSSTISPGPVEMGEAKAINYFAHNNHSLQLIEKNILPESVAAKKARQLIANEPMTPSTTYDSKRQSQMTAMTQESSPRVPFVTTTDSPLRNPRRPPVPPNFQVIPPSPLAADEDSKQLGMAPAVYGPGRSRPSMRKRPVSESFVRSLTRNFSLKNARNKKADQDLDSKLHPFWRPRGFWDGLDDADQEHLGDENHERGLVRNTLGMPQERTVISGPVSLLRSISDGSRPGWKGWRHHVLDHRSSHGSLQKIRATRKAYKLSGIGRHFRFMGLHDLQERMVLARQRKEDERREKRRETLRRSIGANVIPQGDSRFPTGLIDFPLATR